MRRVVLVLLVLILAILAVLLLLDREAPVGPAGPVDEPGAEGVGAPPETPDVADPVPDAAPARIGPASIAGSVTLDGKPVVARVEIRDLVQTNLTTRSLFHPPYSDGPVIAATDSRTDGTFLVAGLAPGKYEATARTADGLRAWARALCFPSHPQTKCYLRLVSGDLTLVGRAVYADGRPFRGFVFVETDWNEGPRPQVVTDEEGRFAIEKLRAGEYSLSFVVEEEFRSILGGVEVPADGERVFLVDGDLETFEGRVVDDATETAVAGATFTWSWSDQDTGRAFLSAGEAGEDGRFTWRAPGRSASFMVDAPGYEREQAFPKEGEDFVVRMKRLATVTGVVVAKADGTPVPGVPVYSSRAWATPTTVTDADGRFEVEAGPRTGPLHVLGNGWVSETLTRANASGMYPHCVTLEPGERREVVLTAVRTGRLDGIVRRDSGEPVAGVPVRLRHPAGWKGFRQDSSRPETTTAVSTVHGGFSFANLVPGFPYQASAEPPEGLPARSREVVAGEGDVITVEIVLPAETWLPVRVEERGTGDPIEGARVAARQDGRYRTPGVLTGPDGRAMVGPLKPGGGVLEVRHDDYGELPGARTPGSHGGLPFADGGADPAEFVVALRKGFFVAGRIREAGSAKPYAGKVWLALHLPAEPGGRSFEFTYKTALREDGTFRLGPVPAGAYDLVLTANGRDAKVLGSWRVTAGDEDLDLESDPATADAPRERMVLRVRGPDGRPATGGVCVIRPGRRWPAFDWLRDPDHELKFVEIGETVWLELRRMADPDGKPVGGLVTGPLDIREGAIDLALPPDRPIEGRVVGPGGEGVGGLRIEAEPVYPAPIAGASLVFDLPATSTAADGSFRIVSLAAGRHVLRLSLTPDYALANMPVVEAGTKGVLVRLGPVSSIALRIRDGDGKPLLGAKAVASVPGCDWAKREATADGEGIATISGLAAAGRYLLDVEPPPGRTDLAPIRIRDWSPAAATLTLPPGALVEGTVRSATGGVPRATVWWRDSRDDWRRIDGDPMGDFRLVALAGSRVTLTAAPPYTSGRDRAGPEVTVDAGTKAVLLHVGE